MQKLFLTSIKIDKLLDIIPKSPKELKVAFIPTAADPYVDKWFAEADRKKLIEFGFKLIEVDLKNKDEDQLKDILSDADIVYFTGGNSFYLLDKVRKSGFDKILPSLLDKGVIYAGSSAGAVIAGATIEPIKYLDDPSIVPELESFEALGLVDFAIIPHYGKEKYKEKHEKTMSEFGGGKLKLVTLTDEQSIIVENDEYKIV